MHVPCGPILLLLACMSSFGVLAAPWPPWLCFAPLGQSVPSPSVCCTGALNLLNAIHPRAEHTIRSQAAPPPFSGATKLVELLLGSPGKEALIWYSLCWDSRRFSLVTSLPLPFMLRNCTSSRNCSTCSLSGLPCL